MRVPGPPKAGPGKPPENQFALPCVCPLKIGSHYHECAGNAKGRTRKNRPKSVDIVMEIPVIGPETGTLFVFIGKGVTADGIF
jgi:hypothetical protein